MQLLEESVPDAGLAGGVGVRRQRERQSQDFDEEIDGVEPDLRVPRVQNPVDQRARLAPLDDHGGFPVSPVAGGRGGGVGGLGIGEEKEENLGVNAKNGEVKRAVEGKSERIQHGEHAEDHRGHVRGEGERGERVVEAARALGEEAAHEDRELGVGRKRLAGGEKRAEHVPGEEFALHAEGEKRAAEHVAPEEREELERNEEKGKPRGGDGHGRRKGGKEARK